MLILDTVGDKIQAEASAALSITITCYGIETISGIDTYKKLGQSQLTGSGTQDAIYTVPADTSTICSLLIIANTTEELKTVSIWHVPNGGSVNDNNAIFKSVNIEGASTVVWNKGEIHLLPDYTKTVYAAGIQSNPTSGQYRITGLRLSSTKEIVVTYDSEPI